MPKNLKIIFEVENLANTSPTIISLSGIVYLQPVESNTLATYYFENNIKSLVSNDIYEYLLKLFKSNYHIVLASRRKCTEVIKIEENNFVLTICSLLKSILETEPLLKLKDAPVFFKY